MKLHATQIEAQYEYRKQLSNVICLFVMYFMLCETFSSNHIVLFPSIGNFVPRGNEQVQDRT